MCNEEYLEAATRGVLLKKVFLEISQNSQENTCVKDSFLIKLQVRPIIFYNLFILIVFQSYDCTFFNNSQMLCVFPLYFHIIIKNLFRDKCTLT